MVHSSFAEWVEGSVIPLQAVNPTWFRLDGRSKGGNRETIARFRHDGQVWQVHGDTQFGPVMRAYQAIALGDTENPFVVEWAKTRHCLNLLASLRGPQRAKYFYVYEEV